MQGLKEKEKKGIFLPFLLLYYVVLRLLISPQLLFYALQGE